MKKICGLLVVLSSLFFIQSVNAGTIINAVSSDSSSINMSLDSGLQKKDLLVPSSGYFDIGFQFTPENFEPGEYAIVAYFYSLWGSSEDLNFTVKSGYDPFTYEVTKLSTKSNCWASNNLRNYCFVYRVTFFVNFGEKDSMLLGYLRSNTVSANTRVSFWTDDNSRQPISVMTVADYKIWKTQQETNEKLDDINNSINSDSSDATSSSCGILCKLKNVVTGIAQLPGKIGEFIVNLGKQIGQFFTDLTTAMGNFFTNLLNGIKDGLTALGNFLIEGIKGLFIPDDMSFIDEFVESIENKLGFIAQIPIKIITFTLNLATASWSEFTSVTFPSVSIFGYYFWDTQEIDLTEAINIFKPFKYFTDVVCVTLFCHTLLKWYERFTGGGSQ